MTLQSPPGDGQENLRRICSRAVLTSGKSDDTREASPVEGELWSMRGPSAHPRDRVPYVWKTTGMRTFEELASEAAQADVQGWGFGWLHGRAVEERPRWGYARLLARRLAQAHAALDLDTGGGEVLHEAPVLPDQMVATEGWPPNLQLARDRLTSRGVEVIEASPGERLPVAEASFDLVTSRHPVDPDWSEIARVLSPGGRYFAQHVGAESAFELTEFFLGPQPVERRRRRHPDVEAAEAEKAGLEIVDLRVAHCRMEFYDVGAVVWILRKCPWWVPDFDVSRDEERLRTMDAHIRRNGVFLAHSTRHLIEARRP